MSRKAFRGICLTILLTLAAGLILTLRWSGAAQARKSSAPRIAKRVAPSSASIQTLRNIGKAYYEQGKYEEAIGEFRKVIASGEAVATDHLDLGQALMEANRLDDALGELTTAKQMAPKLLAIDYNLGVLYKRELRYTDAEAELKRVIQADPTDPPAWFNLGTVYFAEKKLEPALDAHQHVVEMGFGRAKNFYVASTFHCFTILTRLKRQSEAQKFLKINQEVRDKVPAISLQYPALENGKYGGILVPTAPATVAAGRTATEKVTFIDITAKLGIALPPANATPGLEAGHKIKASEYSLDFARRNLVPLFGPSIALGDYDNDGRPDLYLVDPRGTNRLYHNNGDGTFTDVTAKAGVAGPGASLSAVFSDYNNSGHPSLFVAGLGGITLYHNNGDGTFSDVTERAGLKGRPGELDTTSLLFDSDNDGFLDLLVTAYTDLNARPRQDAFRFPDDFAGVESRLYRNNGDGTFTDITVSSGLASAKGRMRGAVFADFNNDGYLDLLLTRDDGPPWLYVNQGEDKFMDRTAEAGAALTKTVVVSAQVADFNHDGNFDLALWSPFGYEVLLNDGNGRFLAAGPLPAVTPPAGLFAFRGTVADVDGDSFDDLLAVDASGRWHFIANQGRRFQEFPLGLPSETGEPFAAMVPGWLTSPGRLDLVAMTKKARFVALEREGPSARWLEVRLSGYKSNTQGVGSIVEFKAGNFYKKVLATGEPVRVFTGGLAKLDVVRTTWPNLVVQNSIDVATEKPLEVKESERLASSCPFLYVWNGGQYVFFTEVMGVAPLGELSPDGSRMKPNPEELVRLGSSLRPQGGKYVFQITDEMREVDYFDQLRLFAVDHRATEEIYANEIYSSLPTRPTLYAVRRKRFPASGADDAGHDVLSLIRKVDGRYPAGFRQNRILGLAELHTLTLDLGDFPSSSRVALWLTGWVFWTDSNASRALMSNSQLRMIRPYLQVRDESGHWVTVVPDMGLPSGTNRTMTVNLTGKFPSADHHIRIVTNLCVYWDQIFFTTEDTAIPVPLSSAQLSEGSVRKPPLQPLTVELPLASADLHYRGFSSPTSDPRHLRPDSFAYARLLALAPWNPMVGRYTRYGAVTQLLAQADDRLVVMSTGDELTVEFDAHRLPPLKPGWKRDFFLYACGYAKDGEPNTAFFRGVAPLPFRNMSNYPYEPQQRPPDTVEYQRYLREYQTRPGYLLIPPLAPPAL